MADPLHLGRLCRLHLARADRAAVDDAAAAAPAEPHSESPAWAHNALGGLPAANNPGNFLGAKTIAATLLDLLTEPALLKQAQDEFRDRTGGGIGGTKWMAPLLPKDIVPPVDLRWPEYIHTARGEEWWIPTPGSGSGERLR